MRRTQAGLRMDVGRARERGAVLVGVMVALLATAGMIGMLYALARTTGRAAGGIAQQQELDGFVEHGVSLCPTFIDAVLGIGNFVAPNRFDPTQLVMDAGYEVQFDLKAGTPRSLQNQLMLSNPDLTNPVWFTLDYDLGASPPQYEPDIIIRVAPGPTGERMRLEIDLDLVRREQGKGVAIEFGTGSNTLEPKKTTVALFRCFVRGTDASGRTKDAYALIRKEY